MHYLALCCIAKDEDPFLREWVAYHALLGVEHFYIYDNFSKRPIREVLGPFAEDSRVTIRRIPGSKMQLPAYDDCLTSFGSQCQWIGFLDLDEFVCPMQDSDLRVLLSEFEPYGGLASTWHLFGSSGHLKRPQGSVIRNYTEAFAVQESYQNKCFVQPSRTAQALSSHYFRYAPGYFCVNEDHYPVSPGCQSTFSPGKRVRVNHYFLRSQQDFEEKLIRGRADTDDPQSMLSMYFFYAGAERACVEDRHAQRILPQLEKALQGNRLPKVTPSLPVNTPFQDLADAAMKFHEAGQTEKALACLCCGDPRYKEVADLWTLRAFLARAAGQTKRADIFIRQSLQREATKTGYAQLRSLLLDQGLTEQAEGVKVILERYAEFFH